MIKGFHKKIKVLFSSLNQGQLTKIEKD